MLGGMDYADHHTDFSRFAETGVERLLRGIIHNEQRYEGLAETSPVTDAIKYASRPIQRPDREPYTGDNEYVSEVLEDVLRFDELIPFQEQCWERLDEMGQRRAASNESSGVVLSAPTGFGKTEGFAGPIFHDLAFNEGERFGKTAIVYPRNALLEDQLERFLVHLRYLNDEYDAGISIGIYNGDTPRNTSGVGESDFIERGQFRLAQWTGGDGEPTPLEFRYLDDEYGFVLETSDDTEVQFSSEELRLSRESVRSGESGDTPDILLTTINSLENFSLKPNYDIINDVRTMVLDEIHLYNGVYGIHAANILQNIRDSIQARTDSEPGILYIGSSATISDATQFGHQLFNLRESNVSTISVNSQDKRATDDTEHFHFVSSSDDVDIASTFIQQILLFAHALLEERNDSERKKAISFIDSVSQVNQRSFQIEDFEDAQRWRHHNQGEDNWWEVAEDTPYQATAPEATTPGHRFIPDLEHQPTSADLRIGADEFGDVDLILSTSLLEVGIDIPAIKVVSQYKSPWEMSQFIQRIGRASREEGTDAHFLVVLGDDANDQSLFHRAERFLDPEIDTRLNTDNEILGWIHSRLYDAFEVAYVVKDQYNHDSRLEPFLREFLHNADSDYEEADELFNEFWIFLSHPQSQVRRLLETSITLPGGNDELLDQTELQNGNGLRPIRQVFTAVQEVQDDQLLSSIAEFVQEPETRYTLQIETIAELDDDIAASLQRLAEQTEDELTSATPASEEVAERITDINEQITTLVEEYEGGDADDRQAQLNHLDIELRDVKSQLNEISSEVDDVSDDFPYGLGLDTALAAVDTARTLRNDAEIDSRITTWRRTHYLKRSLQELYCFANQLFDPEDENRSNLVFYGHLMVRAYKDLLRSIYFFYRASRVHQDRANLEPPFYVPTSYFGEAGDTFSIIPEGRAGEAGEGPDSVDDLYERRYADDEDEEDAEQAYDEVALTKLVLEYVPYMSRYLDNRRLRMFAPPAEAAPDDSPYDYIFDMSSVATDAGEDVATPEMLPVRDVRDFSGNQARSIIRYCTETFYISRDWGDDGPHGAGTMAYGQFHSTPQIWTNFEPEAQTNEEITVSYMDVTVALTGVELEITPQTPVGERREDGGLPFRPERDRQHTEEIGFDQDIGFSITTRGIRWDLTEFISMVQQNDQIQERYYRHNPDGDIEQSARYTAAHFLANLVSDITGVNTAMLFYGVDEETDSIAVFERSEGGQGIVDLFDSVRTKRNQQRFVDAINRVGANPSLINGYLWTNPEFMDAVQAGDEQQVENFIEASDHVRIPTPDTVDKIADRVWQTADRIEEFHEATGVAMDVAYQLRREVTELQFLDGVSSDEAAQEVVADSDVDIPTSPVENLLTEPDVDGCADNLHLAYDLIPGNQSDVLSYTLLEELLREITEYRDSTDWDTETMEREALAGAVIDDTHIFHTL